MKDLLKGELEAQFAAVQNLNLGSIEHEKTVAGLTKLMSTQIELEKFEADKQLKLDEQKRQADLDAVKMELDKQERENRLYLQEKELELKQKQVELQEKQHKENKKNNMLQLLTTVTISLVGFGLTVWGTKYTMEYEDKGVIPTTLAGREHTRGLFNKK